VQLCPFLPHAADTREELEKTEAKLMKVLKDIDDDMDMMIAATKAARAGQGVCVCLYVCLWMDK